MPARTPSVVMAVRRDLRDLEEIAPGIKTSGLAATALAMAREIDDRENTASGMASCARVLEDAMAHLRLLAREISLRKKPPTPTPDAPKDELDELRERARARRSST